MQGIKTMRSARLGLRRATMLGMLAIASVAPAIGWGGTAAEEPTDVVDATSLQERVDTEVSIES